MNKHIELQAGSLEELQVDGCKLQVPNMQPATSNSSEAGPLQHSTRNPQDEVLVRVEGVSKKFCRSLKKSLWYGLCDIASELNPRRSNELPAGGCKLETSDPQHAACNSGGAGPQQPATANPQHSPPLRPGEFWAVNDVSFELRRGECLGLIGHNGAGKTTLLKMLNGLIKPDAGKITMRGRVGALIALGAGFNPILTGRENIYINGSVLGLSKKEIDGKIDEIIDFAEIGEFIDMPVQNYSSGMNVRLGFAVATAMNPDVLIIDEVLAVGDTSFRIKCYNAIRKILPTTAVILVSHSMFDIERVSSSTLVLSHGKTVSLGDVSEGIQMYNRQSVSNAQQEQSTEVSFHLFQGVVSADLTSFDSSSNGLTGKIKLSLVANCDRAIENARLRIVFCDPEQANIPFAEWDSKPHGQMFDLKPGPNRVEAEVNDIRLRSGAYEVRICLCDSVGQSYFLHTAQNIPCALQTGVNAGPWYRI